MPGSPEFGIPCEMSKPLATEVLTSACLGTPPDGVMRRGATEQAASLYVLPKKGKEHVTQMPTGHG